MHSPLNTEIRLFFIKEKSIMTYKKVSIKILELLY